jgi:hypothetical protein
MVFTLTTSLVWVNQNDARFVIRWQPLYTSAFGRTNNTRDEYFDNQGRAGVCKRTKCVSIMLWRSPSSRSCAVMPLESAGHVLAGYLLKLQPEL